MPYTYRKLPPAEWHRLEDIFKHIDEDDHVPQSLPHPMLAEIEVAEDEHGNIVGLLVKQLTAHLEPLWIAPEHRGHVSWTKMVNDLNPHNVYMFAHDGKSARRAEVFGAVKQKFNAVYWKP